MAAAPVVTSEARLWAAALTVTASVSTALKSPAKASVSVVVAPPTAAPATCETVRFGMSVARSKLAAATPATNAALTSRTSTVAPFRPPSASGDGLVAVIEAP